MSARRLTSALVLALAAGLARAQGSGSALPPPGPTAPAQTPAEAPIVAPAVQTPVITNRPGGAPSAPGAAPPAPLAPSAPAAAPPQPTAVPSQPAAAPTAPTAQKPTPPAPGTPADSPADPAAPAGQKPPAVTDVLERNEFQIFVAQSTGRLLPLFGYHLFSAVPSTFAPVDRIPVTPDYVIGPGDQILIRAWGQVDIDYAATVDRNGQINIPKVGTLTVAGLRFQDLHGFLKTAIGRIFRNFELNVTMGELRSIQVFVVGQAARPGTYTVSALSTLVNAIFAAGGPSVRGSMRRIQLRRNGALVVEFDLYDLLVHGDKSKDRRLLPGDVIHFPPIGPLAAIFGSVNNEAIFELKDGTTFGELIRLAGGFTTTAQTQRALVERIFERTVRRVEEVALDPAGLAKSVNDGDVVAIGSITPRFENAVRLQGSVARPARYPWKKDMRVTDLLVDENALITTAFWLRQNQGVLYPRPTQREINFDYATLQRFDPKDLSTRLIAFDLGKAIRGDPNENLVLQPGDVVTIYSFGDALPKTENDVVLQSSLLDAPARRFPWRPGMRLRDLIPDANWLVEYYGYWLRTGGASGRVEINWDYATVARLKPDDLTRLLLPLDLGKAILEGHAAHNLLLHPGDEITIYTKDEIAVPVHRRAIRVRLEGELNHAGIYQVRPGETLRELVARAGGLTPQAYLFGAEFVRESVRRIQEERLKRAIDQLEQDVQRAALERVQAGLSKEDADLARQEIAVHQAMLGRLRNLRPSGRVVLGLPETAKLADLPADLVLEDGDRLHVPARPSMVSVFGAVFNEGAFLHRPEKTLADYLFEAGGPRKEADQRSIFVLRADGSAVSRRQGGWLVGSLDGLRLMPGDAIVVPEELDRTPLAKHLKDWTQIFYQFGLGAAALKVFRGL